MPLDGHAYLVSQGWAGKGTGLRHDAISRPIVVAQKKTLSGIGKDRDEAFPFWDHIFNAAASAIKVKVYDSDSDDTEPSSTEAVSLQRTTTGLISNRRPTMGTPALSDTATPTTESSSSSGSSTPKVSVMTAARQAAARRTLYSMFFRGPILSSEFEQTVAGVSDTAECDGKVEEAVVEVTEVLQEVELAEKAGKKNKRKREQVEDAEEEERRRRKREKKEKDRVAEDHHGKGKKGSRPKMQKEESDTGIEVSQSDREAKKLAKAERKRLRAERRARKAESRRLRSEKEARTLASSQEDRRRAADVQVNDGEGVTMDTVPTSADGKITKVKQNSKHDTDEKKSKDKRKKKS